jgi:hypothetical protein
MPERKSQEGRESGENRQIRGRHNQRPISSPVTSSLFSKRMQVYAYTCTTVVMIGLLLGVGWLYKIEKVQASDSVLMFILGQVLSAWVALTNKIFRITAPNIGSPDN